MNFNPSPSPSRINLSTGNNLNTTTAGSTPAYIPPTKSPASPAQPAYTPKPVSTIPNSPTFTPAPTVSRINLSTGSGLNTTTAGSTPAYIPPAKSPAPAAQPAYTPKPVSTIPNSPTFTPAPTVSRINLSTGSGLNATTAGSTPAYIPPAKSPAPAAQPAYAPKPVSTIPNSPTFTQAPTVSRINLSTGSGLNTTTAGSTPAYFPSKPNTTTASSAPTPPPSAQSYYGPGQPSPTLTRTYNFAPIAQPAPITLGNGNGLNTTAGSTPAYRPVQPAYQTPQPTKYANPTPAQQPSPAGQSQSNPSVPTRTPATVQDYYQLTGTPRPGTSAFSTWQKTSSSGGYCTDFAAQQFNAYAKQASPATPQNNLLTDYPGASKWLSYADGKDWQTSTSRYPLQLPAVAVYSGPPGTSGHVAWVPSYATRGGQATGITLLDMNRGKQLPGSSSLDEKHTGYGSTTQRTVDFDSKNFDTGLLGNGYEFQGYIYPVQKNQ